MNSNYISVGTLGGGGFSYPNSIAVRGCDPGSINITRSGSTATASTLNYILGGTAINEVDYATLPGSITIPSGSASAEILIDPLLSGSSTGIRTVYARIINPYSCNDTINSDTIFIYDQLRAELS